VEPSAGCFEVGLLEEPSVLMAFSPGSGIAIMCRFANPGTGS